MNRKNTPYVLFAAASLVLVSAIYVPAFDAPPVLDTVSYIGPEASPIAVWPPDWLKADSRWLSLLSFSLNRMFFGGAIWGHHLVNLLIHWACGLLLFILSRTVLAHLLKGESQATTVAFFGSLMWLVHPLNSQAVIYSVQRMESLMALFLFASLLGLAVAAMNNSRGWLVASVVFCFLSAASKQVAVAGPPLLYLFDVCFWNALSASPAVVASQHGASAVPPNSVVAPGQKLHGQLQRLLEPFQRRAAYYVALAFVPLMFWGQLSDFASYLIFDNYSTVSPISGAEESPAIQTKIADPEVGTTLNFNTESHWPRPLVLRYLETLQRLPRWRYPAIPQHLPRSVWQ